MSAARTETTATKPEATVAKTKAVRQPVSRMPLTALKESLDKCDAEIKAMVNTALEQMTPGTPFNRKRPTSTALTG